MSRYLVGVVVLLAACAGCTRGDSGHQNLTNKQVSDSARCPVDLTDAVRAAGLKTRGGVEHTVIPHKFQGGVVNAECSQSLTPAGEINIDIFAGDVANALSFTLPQVQERGGLTAAQLQQLRKN